MELDLPHQKAYVMRLLDGLEVVDREKRLKVARAILYLAQGNRLHHMNANILALHPWKTATAVLQRIPTFVPDIFFLQIFPWSFFF